MDMDEPYYRLPMNIDISTNWYQKRSAKDVSLISMPTFLVMGKVEMHICLNGKTGPMTALVPYILYVLGHPQF